MSNSRTKITHDAQSLTCSMEVLRSGLYPHPLTYLKPTRPSFSLYLHTYVILLKLYFTTFYRSEITFHTQSLITLNSNPFNPIVIVPGTPQILRSFDFARLFLGIPLKKKNIRVMSTYTINFSVFIVDLTFSGRSFENGLNFTTPRHSTSS